MEANTHKKLGRSNSNVIAKHEVPFPTKKFRMRSLLWVKPKGVAENSVASFLAQLFPTLIVNMAALSSGVGMGFSAVTLTQLNVFPTDMESDIRQEFSIGDEGGSWVAAIYGLGAVFGGLVAALFGSNYGRRKCLFVLAIPDVLGWILIAAANNLPMILAGRFFTGLAAGGYFPTLQTYVTEIAQPQHRGTLNAIAIPVLATGTFLVYCLGAILDWNIVAAIAVGIPVLMAPGLLLISNSPYWYLQMGDEKKALQAMEKFRSSEANGLSELLAIADVLKGTQTPCDEEDNQNSKRLSIKCQFLRLTKRQNRRPFLILNALMILLLLSGKYIIGFYALEIFRESSDGVSGMHEYLSVIVVGAIKLMCTLAFIPAMMYMNRKILLWSSALVMATAIAVLGVAMYAHNTANLFPYELPFWLPLLCVTVYMAAESLGLGSIPYVYIAELFPAEMRAFLSGLTMSLVNLELFIAVKTFPMLSHSTIDGVPFWISCGACVASILFVILFVPETKGLSLEEIESHFAHKINLHVTPFPTPAPQRKGGRAHLSQSIQFTL